MINNVIEKLNNLYNKIDNVICEIIDLQNHMSSFGNGGYAINSINSSLREIMNEYEPLYKEIIGNQYTYERTYGPTLVPLLNRTSTKYNLMLDLRDEINRISSRRSSDLY